MVFNANTSAVDSISLIASVAGAVVAPISVSAGSIVMAGVLAGEAFINI